MIKIVTFAAMVLIAAVNRLLLTPRLAQPSGEDGQLDTLRQLTQLHA